MAQDIVLWSLSFEIARAVSPQYSSPLPNFTSLALMRGCNGIGRDCYRSKVVSNSQNALAVRQIRQVTTTVAMGINNPRPAISGNGTAIAP